MPTRLLLEGPEFEPLLAQVREEHGPDFKIISAEKIRIGGLGGFFAKQRYELAVEVPDRPAALTERAALPDAGEPIDTWLAHIEASQDRYRALPPTEDARPTLPPRASLVSTAGTAFADVMAGLHREAAPHAAMAALAQRTTTTTDVEPLTSWAPAPAPAQDTTTISTATIEPLTTWAPEHASGPHTARLAMLGVPAELAAKATDTDPYRAVVQALTAFAAAPQPPARPGDVLVVAGELAHALPIARAAAAALHLDPSKVLLAGPTTAGTGIHHTRRISGPAEATRRARRMHRAEVPYVVVVDAPLHGAEDGWVRSVCDGLGATRVWAAVDATRKTADTARYLESLGPVDALAVYAAAACADPGSVLQLGLPVALLDGQPADPHAWAALLGPSLMPAKSPA